MAIDNTKPPLNEPAPVSGKPLDPKQPQRPVSGREQLGRRPTQPPAKPILTEDEPT